MASSEQATAGIFHLLRLDSIKKKFLTFALVATLVPALTTTWLAYVHNKRSLTEKITAELRNASNHVARTSDLWLQERFYDVRVFASSYEVSENLERILGTRKSNAAEATRRLEDYLASVRGRFTDYEELTVFDTRARVVASSGSSGEWGLPEDWIGKITKEERLSSDVYRNEASDNVVMSIAVPITAPDGRFLGGFAAKLNFASIDHELRGLPIGETGHVYLLGKDSAVLVSSRLTAKDLLETRLNPQTVRSLTGQRPASFEYMSSQGVKVVGTLEPAPQLGFVAVAEVSTDEAFAQIAELKSQTMLVVSFLLVGVGLIAYLLSLSVVRPLDRLTKGAAKVAEGDLGVNLPVETRGELGYLTRVFNDMVQRLRLGHEELQRLSVTDGLTGLHNRMCLTETLTREVARAKRQGMSFSVLMIDVDHFKSYNDTFGHLAGDEALKKMNPILTECLRDADFAARYGGEEFFVLLPDSVLDGAVDVAERIHARIAVETFGPTDAADTLTLSIGAAEFPKHGESPESIVAAADQALYRAKRRGRNRTVRAGKARSRPAEDLPLPRKRA